MELCSEYVTFSTTAELSVASGEWMVSRVLTADQLHQLTHSLPQHVQLTLGEHLKYLTLCTYLSIVDGLSWNTGIE